MFDKSNLEKLNSYIDKFMMEQLEKYKDNKTMEDKTIHI